MKSFVRRYVFVLALGGLVTLVATLPTSAGITFVFTESGTGGVDVVGSGTGFADRDPDVTANDWDVQDFLLDFLADTYTATETSANTAAGTFTNVTANVSATISAFSVDRDPTSGDDLSWFTDSMLAFNLGDEYLFSLSASFDVGTLPFSELIVGTTTDVGHTEGSGIADESFGITTLQVVPEPTSLFLLFTSVAALGFAGCWRR